MKLCKPQVYRGVFYKEVLRLSFLVPDSFIGNPYPISYDSTGDCVSGCIW